MGARHSKKSMDVTTTPKKDGVNVEGGDASAVGDGKLERIEEADIKPTTNGTASHNETTTDDNKDVINDKDTVTEKEKDKDTVVEKDDTEKKVNSVGPKLKHLFSFKKSSSDNKDDKDKEKDKDKDTVTEKESETEANNEKKEEAEAKVEETKSEAPVETTTENTESVTTPTEETPASPTTATSPDSKDSKKKDKPKKWFRSISFGKKDKSKPVRDEAAKNGDVTKEETLAEGSEEAENAATSPTEDKSIVPSPTETEAATVAAAAAADSPATADETKEADKSSTIVEKNETPSSSPTVPTPVPSEETKDGDNEKIEKKIENTAEPEAVVEKTKEVITNEVVEEAPKVSPPTVVAEAPVSSVPAGPVITEDVASVTQAIEEIDINEKAVAAAVNENIEAVKTNDIVADMNHQNTLKE